jgi:hypothetical protein
MFMEKEKVKTKFSMGLTKYHAMKTYMILIKRHAMKTYWGSGGKASRILNLATRWRRVVSFTLRLLYLRERAAGTP